MISFIQKKSLASYIVIGDANFSMESTSLTVGGFSQPSVARALIEQSGSAEIELARRILWLFPKLAFSHFDTLKAVDDLTLVCKMQYTCA